MGEPTDDWITESVAAARSRHKVPDEVADLVETSLRGDMGERVLRDKEEKDLAKELLAAMTQTPLTRDGSGET